MPRRALVLLHRHATERAGPELEARRAADHRRVDEEAAQRRAGIAGAATSLRLMLTRADREPLPRPRRRRLGPGDRLPVPLKAARIASPITAPASAEAGGPSGRAARYPW